jgi:hypothetical protein
MHNVVDVFGWFFCRFCILQVFVTVSKSIYIGSKTVIFIIISIMLRPLNMGWYQVLLLT